MSPPARVAWIETAACWLQILTVTTVATREGGVDRNIQAYKNATGQTLSPPARVAWIEMSSP